jgi:flavin-dependent dehydrogenase
MKNIKTDVLVIGAGPSGCVASAYLNSKNIDVLVVEKSKFPRFVIGESLLPRCMDHFDEVGLLDCLKAEEFEVKSGARFIKGNKVCEFEFDKKFSPGWDWTWQVPRANFDQALTNELQRKGVSISFEQEVTDVEFYKDGSSKTTLVSKNGKTINVEAKFVIDSSGHGRVLPRLLGLEKPSIIPKHSSLFTHVKDIRRPSSAEGSRITFDVISTDVWLWVIPFSNGITSIGFVGPTEFFEDYKGSPTDKLQKLMTLSSYYNPRFKDLEYTFEPKIIKNISKSVTQLYGNGFALTGNSAEFLDPVFSSGVTFATESGLLAAKLAVKELNGEAVNWEVAYKDYILSGVSVFSTYVKEWYTGNLQKIFFYDKISPSVKAQICSVLAGYVWDTSNPFVKNHHRLVKTLATVIDLETEGSQKL